MREESSLDMSDSRYSEQTRTPFVAEDASQFTYYSDESLAKRQNKHLTYDTFVAFGSMERVSSVERTSSTEGWRKQGLRVDTQEESRDAGEEETREVTGDIRSRRRQRLARQAKVDKAEESEDSDEPMSHPRRFRRPSSSSKQSRRQYDESEELDIAVASRKKTEPRLPPRHFRTPSGPSKQSMYQTDPSPESPSRSDRSQNGAFDAYSGSASSRMAHSPRSNYGQGQPSPMMHQDQMEAMSHQSHQFQTSSPTRARRGSYRQQGGSPSKRNRSSPKKNRQRTEDLDMGRYPDDSSIPRTRHHQGHFFPKEESGRVESSLSQGPMAPKQVGLFPSQDPYVVQNQPRRDLNHQHQPGQLYSNSSIPKGMDPRFRQAPPMVPVEMRYHAYSPRQAVVEQPYGALVSNSPRSTGPSHPNMPQQYRSQSYQYGNEQYGNQMGSQMMVASTTTTTMNPSMARNGNESGRFSSPYGDQSYVSSDSGNKLLGNNGCQAFQCQSVITRIWTSCGMVDSEDVDPGYKHFEVFAEESVTAFSGGMNDLKEKVASGAMFSQVMNDSLNPNGDGSKDVVAAQLKESLRESGNYYSDDSKQMIRLPRERRESSANARNESDILSNETDYQRKTLHRTIHPNGGASSLVIEEITDDQTEEEPKNTSSLPKNTKPSLADDGSQASSVKNYLSCEEHSQVVSSGDDLSSVYDKLLLDGFGKESMESSESLVKEEVPDQDPEKPEPEEPEIEEEEDGHHEPLTETVWEASIWDADSMEESHGQDDQNDEDLEDNQDEQNDKDLEKDKDNEDADFLAELAGNIHGEVSASESESDAQILAELMGEVEDKEDEAFVYSIFDDACSADGSDDEKTALSEVPRAFTAGEILEELSQDDLSKKVGEVLMSYADLSEEVEEAPCAYDELQAQHEKLDRIPEEGSESIDESIPKLKDTSVDSFEIAESIAAMRKELSKYKVPEVEDETHAAQELSKPKAREFQMDEVTNENSTIGEESKFTSGEVMLRLFIISFFLYVSGILGALVEGVSATFGNKVQPFQSSVLKASLPDTISIDQNPDVINDPIQSEWTKELKQTLMANQKATEL